MPERLSGFCRRRCSGPSEEKIVMKNIATVALLGSASRRSGAIVACGGSVSPGRFAGHRSVSGSPRPDCIEDLRPRAGAEQVSLAPKVPIADLCGPDGDCLTRSAFRFNPRVTMNRTNLDPFHSSGGLEPSPRALLRVRVAVATPEPLHPGWLRRSRSRIRCRELPPRRLPRLPRQVESHTLATTAALRPDTAPRPTRPKIQLPRRRAGRRDGRRPPGTAGAQPRRPRRGPSCWP